MGEGCGRRAVSESESEVGMMLDQIIRLLGESEADAWEVTETRTEGWDLYFIRHDLDQNRIRNTVHTTVRVFRCSGDRSMIGSASEELPPTASEAVCAPRRSPAWR